MQTGFNKEFVHAYNERETQGGRGTHPARLERDKRKIEEKLEAEEAEDV
jgi:hypothetical protein